MNFNDSNKYKEKIDFFYNSFINLLDNYIRIIKTKLKVIFKNLLSDEYVEKIIKTNHYNFLLSEIDNLIKKTYASCDIIFKELSMIDYKFDDKEIKNYQRAINNDNLFIDKNSINLISAMFIDTLINYLIANGIISNDDEVNFKNKLRKIFNEEDLRLYNDGNNLFNNLKTDLVNVIKNGEYKQENKEDFDYSFIVSLSGGKLLQEDGKYYYLLGDIKTELLYENGNLTSLDQQIKLYKTKGNNFNVAYVNKKTDRYITTNANSITLYTVASKFIVSISINPEVNIQINNEIITEDKYLDAFFEYMKFFYPYVLDYLLNNDKFKEFYFDYYKKKNTVLEKLGFIPLNKGDEEKPSNIYVDNLSGNYYELSYDRLKCLNRDLKDILFKVDDDEILIIDKNYDRSIKYNTSTNDVEVQTSLYIQQYQFNEGKVLFRTISKKNNDVVDLPDTFIIDEKFPGVLLAIENDYKKNRK